MQTAYQSYKKQEVEGATKGKIVVLLFEGTIKCSLTRTLSAQLGRFFRQSGQ